MIFDFLFVVLDLIVERLFQGVKLLSCLSKIGIQENHFQKTVYFFYFIFFILFYLKQNKSLALRMPLTICQIKKVFFQQCSEVFI